MPPVFRPWAGNLTEIRQTVLPAEGVDRVDPHGPAAGYCRRGQRGSEEHQRYHRERQGIRGFDAVEDAAERAHQQHPAAEADGEPGERLDRSIAQLNLTLVSPLYTSRRGEQFLRLT